MGWDELLTIVSDTIDQVLAEKSTPPQACPKDGEPLLEGPGGALYCQFDGYQWPRDEWSAK